MSNERDELAREVFIANNSNSPDPAHEWEITNRHNPPYSQYAFEIADGLLAAGYRRPRTITDHELRWDTVKGYSPDEAFPAGMIVQSADGSIWRNDEEDGWDSLGGGSCKLAGPAVVLWEPQS